MSTRLRVCYGGSFDPVHAGHLAIARATRDHFDADVALLPARDPPHKAGTHASGEQRAVMLELAIAGEPGLQVDRRELRRAGPSYTAETLAELRAECGARTPLAWLVGADSLRQLDTWHRWRELFTHAHIIAVGRPGNALDADSLRQATPQVQAEISQRQCLPGALVKTPAGGFCVLPLAGLRGESSSEVRRRLLAGEDWQALLPERVAAYILRKGLYRDPPVILPPSPQSDLP